MKRLFWFFVAAVFVYASGRALHHITSWENYSPPAQKQWLIELFKRKGFYAKWELNNTVSPATFSLKLNEVSADEMYEKNFHALKTSSLIQFYEQNNKSVFFVFGDRIYSMSQNTQTGTENILTLSVPNRDEAWFTVRGGGEFLLGDIKEIIKLFPYHEVRFMQTRPDTLLVMSKIVSVMLVVYPLIGWIIYATKKRFGRRTEITHSPSVAGSEPHHVVKHVSLNQPISISPQQLNHEGQKLNLLATLQAQIDVVEDIEIKMRLQALYGELMAEKRLRIIQYALATKVPAICNSQKDEPHASDEGSANIQDVSTDAVPLTIKKDLIEQAFKEIESWIAFDVIPATRLILQILINPGGAPYFGEHKILRARLLRRVVGSVPFSTPEEFWKAYKFFIKIGAIMESSKHGAGHSCSLNPHMANIDKKEGKNIIGILVRLRQDMTKDHRSKQ